MEHLRLLRPHQWVKNIFVLIPALLAGSATLPPIGVMWAFIAFCLASSAMYVANDIVDAERDRAHATKKTRPIASGAVSELEAWALAAVAAVLSIGLALMASRPTAGFVAAYLVLNLAYSFWTKHVPVLDCASIALGFCLRMLAGGVGFGIPVSPTILASCYFGALAMALIKRRIELSMSAPGQAPSRPSLKDLSLPTLDLLVGVFAATAVALYAHWAIDPSRPLAIFTLPPASILLTRVVWLAYLNKKGEDFSKSLLSDNFALASSLTTLGVLAGALYIH